MTEIPTQNQRSVAPAGIQMTPLNVDNTAVDVINTLEKASPEKPESKFEVGRRIAVCILVRIVIIAECLYGMVFLVCASSHSDFYSLIIPPSIIFIETVYVVIWRKGIPINFWYEIDTLRLTQKVGLVYMLCFLFREGFQ